ncbi:MAG: AMP-binding protein [Acidimicrobiia bacterium]|nr:AMP-binding protein [Acidimicrobiia bacterium]
MGDQSFAQRIRHLAAAQPDAPAITIGAETTTFADLDRWTNRFARRMAELGVGVGDHVTVAEPNSAEFLLTTMACWKIGAIPQPVSARLPGVELEQIVELADSAVVVGARVDGRRCLAAGSATDITTATFDYADLPDAVSPAWKAPTSGGSTGRPKLIVSGDPSIHTENLVGLGAIIGAAEGETMVMPGPLYHNGPFIWSCLSILAGGRVALLPRFDAEETLRHVQAHRASAIYLVPTMMQRIWKLDDETKFSYDLTSLRTAFHLAEPCPKWLKEEWINWIGPDVLFELYGGTEGQMFTVIDGHEWLAHRGSVGKPVMGEIKICDADGNEVEPGVEGEVWMRNPDRDKPTYRYIGDESDPRDGWETLGDMGWVDADGYLYLGDRRSDMILVGGANVYPAEVEAAIGSHPDVLSSAVIGLPDEDKGSRVHAIVQRAPVSELDEQALMRFLAERLVAYKLPRSIEWAAESLRDDAGKVRRSALQAERLESPAS